MTLQNLESTDSAFSKLFIELVLSSKCKPRVKLPMSNQVPTLEKLKSLVRKGTKAFCVLNISPTLGDWYDSPECVGTSFPYPT